MSHQAGLSSSPTWTRPCPKVSAISCARFAKDCEGCFANNCRYCRTSPEDVSGKPLGRGRCYPLVNIQNWLVVSDIFYFPYICDNPSHWLIFFKMVKTTNQKKRWKITIFRQINARNVPWLQERTVKFPERRCSAQHTQHCFADLVGWLVCLAHGKTFYNGKTLCEFSATPPFCEFCVLIYLLRQFVGEDVGWLGFLHLMELLMIWMGIIEVNGRIII